MLNLFSLFALAKLICLVEFIGRVLLRMLDAENWALPTYNGQRVQTTASDQAIRWFVGAKRFIEIS